ncbi:hypothetical protein PSEUDO8BK_10502 [Pseudomonas sp. 8BK]|nr:hypothetical protein PSEUDO8BK_10502 [Pseudomonas sp. 8BK]
MRPAVVTAGLYRQLHPDHPDPQASHLAGQASSYVCTNGSIREQTKDWVRISAPEGNNPKVT